MRPTAWPISRIEGGYPLVSMESLMVARTRCWRGVSPVASGGPSGISMTFLSSCLAIWLSPPGVVARSVRPEQVVPP